MGTHTGRPRKSPTPISSQPGHSPIGPLDQGGVQLLYTDGKTYNETSQGLGLTGDAEQPSHTSPTKKDNPLPCPSQAPPT